MANKHIKNWTDWRCLTSLIIREMQIKTTVRFHLTPVRISSVAQSSPTLCDPTDCSMLGFPVPHQLQEFTQTHVVLGYIKSKSWGRFHPLVLDLSPQGPGRSESIFDLSSAIWRQLFPKLSLLSAKMSWLPQLAF